MDEVLALTSQMGSYIERQTAATPAPQPVQQQPGREPLTLRADDYVTGEALQSYADQFGRQIQPQMQAAINLASQAALDQARGKFAKDFQRWGPEIQMAIQAIPRDQWTLDNLSRVVQFVRAGHLDEIVREEAAQLSQTGDGSMRADGRAGNQTSSSPQNPLKADNIPSDWQARADKAGLTPETVRDFERSNGMAPGEFYKLFPARQVVTEAR